MSNPASFRDLSKPMGAQTPERLKQFRKRYTDWDDPQGKYSALTGKYLKTYNERNTFSVLCTVT